MTYKNFYSAIHSKGHDIEIDWLSRRFEPKSQVSRRIKKSIGYWGDALSKQLASQKVDLDKLESLVFRWPAAQRKFIQATGDRGKEYRVYVSEIK